MLKRAADSPKEQFRAAALEPWVAALSSAVTGSSCEATFTAKDVLPALGNACRWNFAAEQCRFALTLEGGPDDNFGGKQLASIRLAAYLSRIPTKASLDLAAGCGPDKGSKSWSYLIRSTTGQQLLAAYQEEGAVEYLPSLERVCLGKQRSVALILRMHAKDIKKRAYVSFSDALFSLDDPAGELKLSFALRENGGKQIKFCVVEDQMETVNDKCRPTISLGRIEMKIDEVLALRPGMTIAFARPENFPVTLEVMGTPIARGTMTIQDQTLSLVIDDIEQSSLEMSGTFLLGNAIEPR